MGLILDSSILIAAERRGDSPKEVIRKTTLLIGDQDAAISAVGLTELVHGAFRADSSQRQARRRLFVDELLIAMKVYPYTLETAMLAGRIDGEQMAKGVSIPFGDLLIGATALSIGFSVLTTNMRHFQWIPGLNVISF